MMQESFFWLSKNFGDKISSISKGRYFNNKTLYESISSELKRSKNYSTGLVSSKINKSLPSPIFYNDGSNPNPLFSPEEFFSENGPLHKSFKIDSYEKRENQIRYTEFIRHTLSDGGIGIIEAGTGLGKTLSYLLSALERAFVEKNQAVILSCNTKTLQDQLFQHEIPKLASALDMTFSATIIKGHRNYICATRTNNVIERAQIYLSDYDVQSMIVIIIWIQTGLAIVIFSAALRCIPKEMLEAARIDGASELKIFTSIIIPYL